LGYEQALAAYAKPAGNAPLETVEAAWEEWTARPGDFATRQEALAAMTLARVQVLSTQGGQALPPQLHRLAHDWTDPARIPSAAVAYAVAKTPVGGVSSIIEDPTGWHLVRVVARRPAPAPTPAFPAQAASFHSPAATVAPAPVIQLPAIHASGAGVVQWQLPPCNCK